MASSCWSNLPNTDILVGPVPCGRSRMGLGDGHGPLAAATAGHAPVRKLFRVNST
jgi:hypothetical protein